MILRMFFAIFNFYKYYILRFCANPQKYQKLVYTRKNSHLKVYILFVGEPVIRTMLLCSHGPTYVVLKRMLLFVRARFRKVTKNKNIARDHDVGM